MDAGPAFQTHLQFEHRRSKCAQIEQFFFDDPGHRYPSPWLHGRFGTSFRARVSEVNRDPQARVTICNENCYDKDLDAEVSVYWGELR